MSRSSAQSVPSRSTQRQRGSVFERTQERLYEDRRFESKTAQPPGILICNRCGAISYDKHWYIDPDKLALLVKNPNTHQTHCPGCERVERKIYEGQVVLESPLLTSDKDAVIGLIKHIEGKAWHDNPSSRIASMTEENNRIDILTTTRWLASRIGKEFQKCYKGSLEIKPSPREKFVRVYWSRP